MRQSKRASHGEPRGRLWRVVCHVGAGTPAKQWPWEYWLELVAWLLEEQGAEVHLVGGCEDRERAWQLQKQLKHPARLHNHTGGLSWSELAELLDEAELCIGADSAVAHLAAAVGCPVVALFSRTNQVRQWRPWGRGVVLQGQVPCGPCHREQCPVAGHPCMAWLTPAVVQVAVKQQRTGKQDPFISIGYGEFLLQSPPNTRYNAADI